MCIVGLTGHETLAFLGDRFVWQQMPQNNNAIFSTLDRFNQNTESSSPGEERLLEAYERWRAKFERGDVLGSVAG